MAGPVAAILIAEERAAAWRPMLAEMAKTIGARRAETEVVVRTTYPVGGRYKGSGWPFEIDPDDRYGQCDEDFASNAGYYERTFGFRPNKTIIVAAMCSGECNNQILAELTVFIAEQTAGIIDMCGLLMPRSVSCEDRCGASWSDLQARVDAFTAQLPGKAVAIPYEVDGGRIFASHRVDATFLQAWLQHPDFHMIK